MGTAFGLTVDAPEGLDLVDALAAGTADRRVEIVVEDAARLTAELRSRPRACLLDRRFPSGGQMLRIEHFEGLGYLVAAPRYGRHLISPDGCRIRSALPRVPALQWQRLFFAQVLPLAAVLQGLEILHASAVVVDGGAVGFVAASGTGKTSLAVNLAATGAELLTDDVLAIDVGTARPTAYAGARLVNVARNEYAELDAAARRRVGAVVGRTEKVHLRPADIRPTAPLAALYFLRRDSSRAGPVDIRLDARDDARLVLGSGFISYMSEPQHMLAHLEASARLARDVPTFVVTVPAGRDAPDVALAVAAHATSELG
jgi:hypothetical protein